MNNQDYFDYLRRRSPLGYFYRRYYLYPLLQSNLINPVLDIGCGIGDYLNFNSKAIGMDINSRSVNFLQEHGLNAFLMRDNKLPQNDNSFPSIILDNVLEHIQEPLPLLCEIYRVLKVKGRLIVGVPGIKGYRSDPDHKIFYTEDKLINVLESAGFSHFKTIITPFNCQHMSRVIKQYCVYGLFSK
tara:strand:- start:930 stop:1487 length:558 start_codon:yes stop_codon:yes gene_type:complete